MGYTHYWSQKEWDEADRAGWQQALPIIKKIVRKYRAKDSKIIQWECGQDVAPEVNAEVIRFNGIGEDGHETFRVINMVNDFDFTKTARKPYDLPVCEVLLVLNAFCPHFELSSDGFSGYLKTKEIDGEWTQAIENVRAYGIDYHVAVTLERDPYCDMRPILDGVRGVAKKLVAV